MAKVSAPLHSSEARGAVGSHVYNTWRGLHIVKTRSGPTITHSEDQLALRAIAAQFTQLWKTLNDAQRTAWNTFAVSNPDSDWTGQPKRLSGYNWFIRINVRLQLALNDWIGPPPEWCTCPMLLPPSNFNRIDLKIYDFTDEPGLYIMVDWLFHDYENEFGFVEIRVAGPHSTGRNPTVKQADRKITISLRMNTWVYETEIPGRYTFFLRYINPQGIVCPWIRGFCDHAAA